MFHIRYYYHFKDRIIKNVPTSNGEDLTDVDPKEAEAACANKAQSL